MKKHAFAAGILSAVILASCTKEVQTETPGYEEQSIAGRAAPEAEEGVPGGHVPNEVLVKFKRGTPATARQQALERMSAQVKEHILTKAMERFGDDEGVYLVHTPLEVMSAVAQMRVLGEVEYAEPNYVYTHQVTLNDPYYTNGSLWGMHGDGTSKPNAFGSQAGEAWAAGKTGSSTVYVGIIDEGVMYNHTDLSDNIWTNGKEIAGNGVDDDKNGLVDDTRGWDFDANDNTTFDGGSDDHGTHVAGTVGAQGGNGTGVAGVVWDVQIITAKFLGRRGGTTANAIKAVDYITNLKLDQGLNIVATNNSWGGGGYSKGLEDAIGRANNANILFIAAAGNDGRNIETSASYPASYTNANIIAVASITSSGALSSFSNYGSSSVDIGAPGSGIYSTLPDKRGTGSTYGSYSGTSMATPHVTGAAALYAASHPGSNAATIRSAILGSAVSTPSLAGKCATGGRLNVSGF